MINRDSKLCCSQDADLHAIEGGAGSSCRGGNTIDVDNLLDGRTNEKETVGKLSIWIKI